MAKEVKANKCSNLDCLWRLWERIWTRIWSMNLSVKSTKIIVELWTVRSFCIWCICKYFMTKHYEASLATNRVPQSIFHLRSWRKRLHFREWTKTSNVKSRTTLNNLWGLVVIPKNQSIGDGLIRIQTTADDKFTLIVLWRVI